MPKRPYPRHQRRHNAILLAVLGNPAQTQKEIAAATGYSPSQVSRIICSPEFQELYSILIQEAAVNARSNWLAGASPRG
jgi:DNA-binding MarR family transcriptional regulator